VTGVITIPEIIAAGAVLLALFLYYQARRQSTEPLLPFAVFKDRNFTLMTFVMAAMGFAILGIYLPLTIYMQSVLGLSAIDAGVTLAIQPVAMFLSSGFAGALAQKINGKYLLIPGLLALAAGTGYIDWAAHAGAGRWDFTAGLVLSGLGMGCIWTPVFSIGTRDLPAHLGGVASGVINTIQELGGVLASAVVGAFLQNRPRPARPGGGSLWAASHAVPPAVRRRLQQRGPQRLRGGRGPDRGEPGPSGPGPRDRRVRLHPRVRRRHAPNAGPANGSPRGGGRRVCVGARAARGRERASGARGGRGLTYF